MSLLHPITMQPILPLPHAHASFFAVRVLLAWGLVCFFNRFHRLVFRVVRASLLASYSDAPPPLWSFSFVALFLFFFPVHGSLHVPAKATC